jgi:hypothetical protein
MPAPAAAFAVPCRQRLQPTARILASLHDPLYTLAHARGTSAGGPQPQRKLPWRAGKVNMDKIFAEGGAQRSFDGAATAGQKD